MALTWTVELEKRGRGKIIVLGRPWTFRTFSLTGHILTYFEGDTIKGSFNIENSYTEELSPSAVGGRDFGFAVVTPSESLHLNAPNAATRALCIRVFQTRIDLEEKQQLKNSSNKQWSSRAIVVKGNFLISYQSFSERMKLKLLGADIAEVSPADADGKPFPFRVNSCEGAVYYSASSAEVREYAMKCLRARTVQAAPIAVMSWMDVYGIPSLPSGMTRNPVAAVVVQTCDNNGNGDSSSSKGMSPIEAERAAEEQAMSLLAASGADVICKQKYRLDDDGDFLQLLRVGSAMQTALLMCVTLRDPLNVHWKEAQAMQFCLRLGERNTQGSRAEFTQWQQKLRERYDDCVSLSDEPDKGRVVMLLKLGDLTQNFSNGKTQKLAISVDSDGDWKLEFQTDAERFELIVQHQLRDESFSRLSCCALRQALWIAEPGDKMDASIFLQHCARLQKEFNIVKTYRSGATLGAFVKPSALSVAQSGLNFTSTVPLPVVTTGDVDWSEDTKRRLNNGGVSLMELIAGAGLGHYCGGEKSALEQARMHEEETVQQAQMIRKNVVLRIMYGFSSDGNFVVQLVGGKEPNLTLVILVRIVDRKELTWLEAKAVADALILGERSSQIDSDAFNGWREKLHSKFGEASYSVANGYPTIFIQPRDCRCTFGAAKVQTLLFDRLTGDSSDVFVLLATTDAQKYCVAVQHEQVNGSFSLLQGKTLKQLLMYFETGEKMDDSIFLQCCARLNQSHNIVRVYRRSGVLVAAVVPTTLTASQVSLPLPAGVQLMQLPACNNAELDWSEETRQRLLAAGDDGSNDNNGQQQQQQQQHQGDLPVYGNGQVRGIRLLKASGQADVFSGTRSTKSGDVQRVAIKVYHNRSDWESCKDEVMNLLRISGHVNVIDVLDFYEMPKPCLVTRLVDGGDLLDYLESHGAMNWPLAATVLKGIAAGLKHLHDHSIVHRDLKSPNVLLQLPSMQPVLIDMGLGQTMDSNAATQMNTNGNKGTLLWMAPEMMTDNKWSTKTDIFALGVIMWEVLSGKVPYFDLAMNPQQLVIGVAMQNLRPTLSAVQFTGSSSCSQQAVVDLMQKCWDTNHSTRPSADDFLLAMEALQ